MEKAAKQIKKEKWIKPTEVNDWEYITTFIGKKEFVCPKSKLIRVQFPDGKVSTVPVKMETQIGRYNDMGHESTVHSSVPWIKLDIHGASVWIKLVGSPLKAEG